MATYPAIQIQHSPQTTYSGNAQNNYIGAQTVAGQRGTLPSFTDANAMFVSKLGADTNPGTQEFPKLTLNGCFASLPFPLQYVVILDSGTYSEGFTLQLTQAQAPYFVGIYAADGQAPVFTLQRGAQIGTYGAGNAARVVTLSANYYISKAGSNATGARGSASTPFLTIQAALSDSARQSGDVFQVQDSGVYQEDLAFGTLPSTLQAAQGQTPTIKWKSAAQIVGFSGASGVPSVDGFTFLGSQEQADLYANTNASMTTAIIYFNNCTLSDFFALNGLRNADASNYPGATFTNCLFYQVYSINNFPSGPFEVYYANNFTNCFFSANSGSASVYFSIGFAVGTAKNCTFNNLMVTGPKSGAGGFPFNSNIPTGIYGNSNVFEQCFFNNSSLYFEYANFLLLTTTFNYAVTVKDCIFWNGFLTVDYSVAIGSGTPTAIVTVNVSNTTIYAPGQPTGLSLLSQTNITNELPNQQNLLAANVSNVVVSGAQTNFKIQRTAAVSTAAQGTVLSNLSSLAATQTGLLVTGFVDDSQYEFFTIQGILDSGSPTPWTYPTPNNQNIFPVQSESGAVVLSTSEGSQNCTLASGDLGNFTGPNNANGGITSIGYDYALFDISIPCVLNGLTFQGWMSPLLTQALATPANMEGGIQSSAGATLTVQHCTFTTYGTYAVKATAGSTIENTLFEDCAGAAVSTNASLVTVQRCAGIGCAGAFILNYGQANTFRHDTSYSCAYGQYDSLVVGSAMSTNNVFAGSGTYDYSGNLTLTYSCVGTIDVDTIGSLDAYSIQLDPLFRNANGNDVGLQGLAYGYFWNSPCIGRASDGKDMGAFDVQYGTASTTWTTINFGENDPETNEPWRNPDKMVRKVKSVKLAEGNQENGAVYSVAATYKSEYEMTWNQSANDMPHGQTYALMQMFESFTNQVQVDFGDERGFVPGFFVRADGFEYEDMIGSYADDTNPLPVKQITIQAA